MPVLTLTAGQLTRLDKEHPGLLRTLQALKILEKQDASRLS
jgi:hypothetical protein